MTITKNGYPRAGRARRRALALPCFLLLFLAISPVGAQEVDLTEALSAHGADAILSYLREQPAWAPEQLEIRVKLIRLLANPANKGNEEVKNQLLNIMQEGYTRFATRNNMTIGYWQTRAEAALAFVKLGETAAVPAIIQLAFYDPDIQVQMCAVRALGRLKDERAVPALIDMLATTDIDRLVDAIVQALGDIGDKRAFPALIACTFKSINGKTQNSAINAIKRLKW